jgi:hypothetical protein
MSRRLLAAVIATIALVALLGPPVAVGASPEIHVTPVQPTPGERVTVIGSGFCSAPCSAVSVSVDGSVVATGVTVATDGTFAVMVGLTPVAGDSTITASQTDASGAVRQATTSVHIVASDPAGPTATAPPAGTSQPPTAAPPEPSAAATVAPSGAVTLGAAPEIHVTPVQPTPGERVTVQGSGFCPSPCSAVSVSVDGSVAASGVTVSADGIFEVMVGLTPVAGDSTISASQTDAGGAVREATVSVHVVASDQAGPTPSAEPVTQTNGNSSATTPWLLVAAVVVGLVVAGAWWLQRRRSATS